MQSGLEQVHRPTKFGGLRVLDIYKFSHALQLKSENKPSVRMEIPYTKTDRRLFITTTKLQLKMEQRSYFGVLHGYMGFIQMTWHPQFLP